MLAVLRKADDALAKRYDVIDSTIFQTSKLAWRAWQIHSRRHTVGREHHLLPFFPTRAIHADGVPGVSNIDHVGVEIACRSEDQAVTASGQIERFVGLSSTIDRQQFTTALNVDGVVAGFNCFRKRIRNGVGVEIDCRWMRKISHVDDIVSTTGIDHGGRNGIEDREDGVGATKVDNDLLKLPELDDSRAR